MDPATVPAPSGLLLAASVAMLAAALWLLLGTMLRPLSAAAGAIRDIFGRDKALIGMIHCPAFPGAPRYRGGGMDAIYDACMRDAERLVQGGMHGLIVENHGDIPFSKPDDIGPETPAFLSVVTDRIKRAFGLPIGINVIDGSGPILA